MNAHTVTHMQHTTQNTQRLKAGSTELREMDVFALDTNKAEGSAGLGALLVDFHNVASVAVARPAV